MCSCFASCIARTQWSRSTLPTAVSSFSSRQWGDRLTTRFALPSCRLLDLTSSCAQQESACLHVTHRISGRHTHSIHNDAYYFDKTVPSSRHRLSIHRQFLNGPETTVAFIQSTPLSFQENNDSPALVISRPIGEPHIIASARVGELSASCTLARAYCLMTP